MTGPLSRGVCAEYGGWSGVGEDRSVDGRWRLRSRPSAAAGLPQNSGRWGRSEG